MVNRCCLFSICLALINVSMPKINIELIMLRIRNVNILLSLLISLFALNSEVACADEGLRSAQNEIAGKEGFIGHHLDVDSPDLGVVYAFSRIVTKVTLTNTELKPIQLDRIESGRKGQDASVSFTPTLLLPGQSAMVNIMLPGDEMVGQFSHIFYAYSSNQAQPLAKIGVRGFADWIVDPVSTNVDLGLIKSGESFERRLEFSSRPGTEVKFKSIVKPSGLFDARISGDGKSIILNGRRINQWGVFDELLVVSTDNELQRKVGVRLRGEVRGAVVANMNFIDFSVIRAGQEAEAAIRLVDETGHDLNIGELSLSGGNASAVVEKCIPAVDSCGIVKLRLGKQELGKPPRGILTISLPHYGSTIPIPYGGSIIASNAVIRNLDDELRVKGDSRQAISSALREGAVAPKAIEMPIPEGSGPLLKWEMANEIPIFGYEIYRAESFEGPYTRANSQIIRRLSSSAPISSVYRWRDLGAEKGKQYWYYVGVVYSNGRKEALSAAQRVVAE